MGEELFECRECSGDCAGMPVQPLNCPYGRINSLTAENAALRAQLAAAVELLRNVRNANSVTRIIMEYDDIDALLKKVKLQ